MVAVAELDDDDDYYHYDDDDIPIMLTTISKVLNNYICVVSYLLFCRLSLCPVIGPLALLLPVYILVIFLLLQSVRLLLL